MFVPVHILFQSISSKNICIDDIWHHRPTYELPLILPLLKNCCSQFLRNCNMILEIEAEIEQRNV